MLLLFFDKQAEKPAKLSQPSQTWQQRVRLTVHLSLVACQAIREIQHQQRTEQGRAIPIWKVIDRAVRAYAREQGIKLGGVTE